MKETAAARRYRVFAAGALLPHFVGGLVITAHFEFDVQQPHAAALDETVRHVVDAADGDALAYFFRQPRYFAARPHPREGPGAAEHYREEIEARILTVFRHDAEAALHVPRAECRFPYIFDVGVKHRVLRVRQRQRRRQQLRRGRRGRPHYLHALLRVHRPVFHIVLKLFDRYKKITVHVRSSPFYFF